MQDLIITPQFTIPAQELEVSFMRSSGPGGQNVNKVNSKVRLAWNVAANTLLPIPWTQRILHTYPTRIGADGCLTILCQLHREQSRNLMEARAKLRQLLLACQYPPRARKATQPTLGSRLRRLEGKKQLSSKKHLRRPPDSAQS